MKKIIKLFRRILNIREARVVFVKARSCCRTTYIKKEILWLASKNGGWIEHSWVDRKSKRDNATAIVIIVSTYREYERFIKNIEESKILKLNDDVRIIP